MKTRHSRSFHALLGAIVGSMVLGACGVDDVQLNGKIFDALGVGGTQQSTSEPKVAARAPLVVPPSLERLPEPGSAPTRSQTVIAGVNDPDAAQTADRGELERQQAEYCKKHYEPARAANDDSADLIKGPLGYCRGSILTSLPKALGGDEGEDEEVQN